MQAGDDTFIKKEHVRVLSDIYYFEWMKWPHIGFIHSPGCRVDVPPHLKHTWDTLEEGVRVHKPSKQKKRRATTVKQTDIWHEENTILHGNKESAFHAISQTESRTHSPALMMTELALMGKPKILASSDVSLKMTFFPSAFSSGKRQISGTL